MSHADRILAVDDEPANLLLLRYLLEHEGYTEIVTELDPRRALELFPAFHPDLVLLDLHMPGLDGFMVLDWIRRHAPPDEYLPVLVLTGDQAPETVQRALVGGASDFLAKPFDPVEATLRIRNLLNTRRLHAALARQNQLLEERVAERTRELEIALRRAEAATEAKAQFLAKMSHELRTPLNPIRGALELLRGTSAEPDPVAMQRLLDMAGRNVDRMATLINEILYLQGLEQGAVRPEIHPMHLGAVAAEVAERAQRLALAQGLSLQVEAPRDIRRVHGDAALVADLLWRLVENALRFTPEGAVCIRVVADAAGTPVRVEVSDTGIGVPAERIATIFDPFEQADNSSTRRYEGAGIGLSLCRALCDLLGYRLEVWSELGRGSTFAVVLP